MRAARRLRPPEWPPAPQRGQADPERSTRRALGPVVSRVGARGEMARRGLLAIGGTGSPGPRVLLHGARGWEESAVTQGWGMGTGPRGSSAGKPARGGKCLGLVGHRRVQPHCGVLPAGGCSQGSSTQSSSTRSSSTQSNSTRALCRQQRDPTVPAQPPCGCILAEHFKPRMLEWESMKL